MADIRLLFNKSCAKRRKIDSDDESRDFLANLAPKSDIDDGDTVDTTRQLSRTIVHTGHSQVAVGPDDALPESLSQSELALDSEIDCEVDNAHAERKSDGDSETELAEDVDDNAPVSVSGKV